MQSYRIDPDRAPPVRADELADAQGRKGLPPIVIDERKFIEWSRLRILGFGEQDLSDILGCTLAQIRKLLREEPWRSIWRRGHAETKAALLTRQVSLARIQGAAGVNMAIHLGRHYLGQVEARPERQDRPDDEAVAAVEHVLRVSLRTPRPRALPAVIDAAPEDETIDSDNGIRATLDVPPPGNGHL